MMKQLKQVWKLGVILAVVGVWSGARAWAAAPSSTTTTTTTTVTVSIAPYAEITIAPTAEIQYSGNPHEEFPKLPSVLRQLAEQLGTNYRFTTIPFTVARNAAITLKLSFDRPFQSSGGVQLATGAAITDNPLSGDPKGLGDSNPYVYWNTKGHQWTASYSKQSAATVDSYRLYVAAGFGDQVQSQAAGDYTTTFTITVAASLS